jgi:dynein heavy chain
MGMLYGGAPSDPAVTGKTETAKDLGKILGIFVVVTNCSNKHKYRNITKVFVRVVSGVVSISPTESLLPFSVVAGHFESSTQAKKQNVKNFMFPVESAPIQAV